MTQAKILWEKGVPYLPRPRIQGMALQTSLHPNRTDLLPKMLLRIADNLLGYVVCQRVVRLIMNGDARHAILLFHQDRVQQRGVVRVQRRTSLRSQDTYAHF